MEIRSVAEKIQLIDVVTAPQDVASRVLSIRNEEEIREMMYNNGVISENEHSAWLNKLAAADDRKFFAVVYDGDVIGGVGMDSIDRVNRRANWAFYLSKEQRGKGLGKALEFRALETFFAGDEINKLNCEVMSFNASVIKLHKQFGFSVEGTRRAHIRRDVEYCDVVLLGITASEWRAVRDNIAKGQWSSQNDPQYYMDLIDRIQAIRGRNNKNWMDLLRLSFKLSPKEAAQIVSSIYQDDGEISELAKKLLT
ncbi:UDP-4-amino-4,6-dideoxy-N-acetyl-beta-L-altrosamine N-acetyltransferase [Rhizobium sp. Nf11,1]|uniref:UDP-4-amino-4, 6-dideoxy-N-acetyl-beta-L-altrosamine N-acetyltransferase n=1 Tax=Rhizobium sp. Nf11,1 TaxID=3404923 RepID=UPI003D348788